VSDAIIPDGRRPIRDRRQARAIPALRCASAGMTASFSFLIPGLDPGTQPFGLTRSAPSP